MAHPHVLPAHLEPRRFRWELAFAVLALGALTGPAALLEKYQRIAAGRVSATYLTSQLGLYAIAAAAAFVILRLRRSQRKAARACLAACVVTLLLTSLFVRERNVVASRRIRALMGKWEAATLLAACADPLGRRQFVAPQMYYATGTRADMDWSGYWRTWTEQRGLAPLELKPTSTSTRSAVARLYYSDSGALRLVAVSGPRYHWVIGRGASWPSTFVDEAGRFVRVSRGWRWPCLPQGARATRVERGSPESTLTPVWGLPPAR